MVVKSKGIPSKSGRNIQVKDLFHKLPRWIPSFWSPKKADGKMEGLKIFEAQKLWLGDDL